MQPKNLDHSLEHFAGIEGKVICIFGPTACGKTDLACRVFDSRDVYDIISVDSALVYKDMNIGTAKPTEGELKRYPHALVNIIDPTMSYSAAEFVVDTKRLISRSHNQGRIPILVGGTMLYFQALLGGMDVLPKANAQLRAKLEKQRQLLGTEALHKRLSAVDGMTASRLNPTDTQRILRALEVHELTGMPLSTLQTDTQLTPPPDWQLIGIEPNRAWLHERIEKRLDMMWQAGFFEEVQGLLKKYALTEKMPSMRCVGYRQVFEYIKSTKTSKDDRLMMQNKALFATRQLAKRQYTWLRKFKKKYDVQVFQSSVDAVSVV